MSVSLQAGERLLPQAGEAIRVLLPPRPELTLRRSLNLVPGQLIEVEGEGGPFQVTFQLKPDAGASARTIRSELQDNGISEALALLNEAAVVVRVGSDDSLRESLAIPLGLVLNYRGRKVTPLIKVRYFSESGATDLISHKQLYIEASENFELAPAEAEFRPWAPTRVEFLTLNPQTNRYVREHGIGFAFLDPAGSSLTPSATLVYQQEIAQGVFRNKEVKILRSDLVEAITYLKHLGGKLLVKPRYDEGVYHARPLRLVVDITNDAEPSIRLDVELKESKKSVTVGLGEIVGANGCSFLNVLGQSGL